MRDLLVGDGSSTASGRPVTPISFLPEPCESEFQTLVYQACPNQQELFVPTVALVVA